jgi:serine/threonine protein kinase
VILKNVLVVSGSPKWLIKLADFGLSKRLTESTVYQTQGGTPPYMAPEILQYIDTDSPNGEYTNAVDLWAVGCIAYRIITGHVPFSTPKLIKYCTDNSQFPSDRLYGIGITRERACFKFIRELLAAYPTERPSASQALNHAWITPGNIQRHIYPSYFIPELMNFIQALLPRKTQMIFHAQTKAHLECQNFPSLSRIIIQAPMMALSHTTSL